MKTIPLVAAALAALALAAPVGAKELVQATICGASACKTVRDPQTLRTIPTGGEATAPIGRPAPYYTLTFGDAREARRARSALYYVPSANAIAAFDPRGQPRYLPIFGSAATNVMRRLTTSLEPFAVPRVDSVRVGARTVTGDAAQTYLRLFEESTSAKANPYANDWITIDLRAARLSPWTQGVELAYSPSHNALERGWNYLLVPESIADDVEAARALDPSGRTWLIWVVAAAALAGALAVVAAARGLRGLRGARVEPA